MKIAVILFILMYVLIIFLPKYRVWAALGIAALFLVLGILVFCWLKQLKEQRNVKELCIRTVLLRGEEAE